MLTDEVVVGCALIYMGLLFGIAYYGDKCAGSGRSIIANPYIYTLSIAVYCTAWTFYGSVGRAAETGVGFLPIYIGPTLVAILFWSLLRRIVHISKAQRITSIADFIASRYGKSTLLGGMVTVIAVVGIMPYISIQLEAIAISLNVLRQYPISLTPAAGGTQPFWADTSLYTALLLIAFTILFGTRHIDNTERHEGLVAAVAFESVFKLLAFLSIGLYLSYGMFGGFSDISARAAADPKLARLLSFDVVPGGFGGWFSMTFIAMMAFLFLPRQFQILVVENVNQAHLHKASWLFPLYLLVINLFVLPIAFGGLLIFEGQNVNADTFVLALPMAAQQPGLALLVFLGGLSAATSMVIVASVALSTMICNDLVMPLLLRLDSLHLSQRDDLSGLLLAIRRASIALTILLGYLFFRLVGEVFPLVTIGLLSFAAAAQFAPAIILGMYWRRASRVGAIIGLSGGFFIWSYTLLLPLSGWLDASVIEHGPFGLKLLSPYRLLGLEGLDPVTHAVFWSMIVNVGGLVLGSLLSERDAIERVQATRFVDVFEHDHEHGGASLWRGTAKVAELQGLVARFIGRQRAEKAFTDYANQHKLDLSNLSAAGPAMIQHAEQLLAGAIGAASARVMVATVAKGETLGIEEVMTILDESSEAIRTTQRLAHKSKELEIAYAELHEANTRLRELDRLKDEFVSTVSHELRTPLTSIRAFSEILLTNPEMEGDQRDEFLSIIVKESERLTRLINQVLDMAKIDAGHIEWQSEQLDIRALVQNAVNTTRQLFEERNVELEVALGHKPIELAGDTDRLTQVIINLLSNAAKFCADDGGEVAIRMHTANERIRIEVQDNGQGIPLDQCEQVFERFHQVSNQQAGKPKGTGLGLPISRRIVEHHGGKIWAESEPDQGATFIVELPQRNASEVA